MFMTLTIRDMRCACMGTKKKTNEDSKGNWSRRTFEHAAAHSHSQGG
jgi:hypothetical protein